MKKQKISDALGNIRTEYIEESADFKAQKNGYPNKKAGIKWASIAACFIIIAGSLLCAPALVKHFRSPDFADQELPVPLEDILWIEDNQDHIANGGSVALNGWEIDCYLYEVMIRADDTEYIAMIVRKYIPYGDNSFVYKGATFWELRDKQDELFEELEKLRIFIKQSESLKYGELLYTTGTPDGERWTKEGYDEAIAYYGEEFIAKYIVDGQVNHGLLDEDIRLCELDIAKLSEMFSELYDAYHKSYVNEVKEIFTSAGVYTIIRNDTVFIFIQKNELENLNIEGRENLVLEPASRPSFDINTNS